MPPHLAEPTRCPDCGAELPANGAIAGLCPQCLLSLALRDSALGRDPDEAPTLDGPGCRAASWANATRCGELLGRGGMGEVWRAFDLKLRVDVALKAVVADRAENERARDMLRQEVRSAREVVSPNVCRIFDLVVEDGQELVSMEYIDGTTLADTLRVRGPLQLQEAREIASQFLSGLEAIHQAGLVHRDFKPENVMLTRAGRVVVMDFGLAKGRAEVGTGTISGTPAYMSPEQARGEPVDARADVFSAGVVLAEMLTVGGEGIRARQALWRAVRESPPQVPEGPWAPVLRQALDPQAERRPASARALAHALEEVTLRLPGFEEKRPYPGLASFSAEDAEYFFGREVEVEAIWKKLKRPRLLGLIGPSGAGKSSFLRAGLLPTLPKSWTAVLSTPGSAALPVPGPGPGAVSCGRHAGGAVPAALRGSGDRGPPRGALAPAPRASARRRGPVRGAVHAESPRGAGGLRRGSSGGWSWRPTSTCCSRCGTTSCSTAMPTRRWRRSSAT